MTGQSWTELSASTVGNTAMSCHEICTSAVPLAMRVNVLALVPYLTTVALEAGLLGVSIPCPDCRSHVSFDRHSGIASPKLASWLLPVAQ